MRVCMLQGLEGDGDEAHLGTVYLDHRNVTATYEPGHERLVQNVLQNDNVNLDGDAVSLQADPEAWFDALPSQYQGTYFWAAMQPEILPEQATT